MPSKGYSKKEDMPAELESHTRAMGYNLYQLFNYSLSEIHEGFYKFLDIPRSKGAIMEDIRKMAKSKGVVLRAPSHVPLQDAPVARSFRKRTRVAEIHTIARRWNTAYESGVRPMNYYEIFGITGKGYESPS